MFQKKTIEHFEVSLNIHGLNFRSIDFSVEHLLKKGYKLPKFGIKIAHTPFLGEAILYHFCARPDRIKRGISRLQEYAIKYLK